MNQKKYFLIGVCGIAVVCLAVIWVFNAIMGNESYVSEWEVGQSRSRIEDACRAQINKAEKEAAQTISRRATEFYDFVQSRKSGAEPFSKDIVSLYGKWRVVSPYIPFSDKEGHKKYVVEKFDQHIFNSEELATTVKRSIEDAIKDIDGIENHLAVALREEILGRSLAPNEIPVAAENFRQSIERLIAASQWDATKSAGSLVVSEVAAQIATQVFIKLGVSAGILSTSAANSWWSFGAALVIGLVVDFMWEWIDDPAGDIEREIVVALEDLATNGKTAIQDELMKILTARSALWTKSIAEDLS